MRSVAAATIFVCACSCSAPIEPTEIYDEIDAGNVEPESEALTFEEALDEPEPAIVARHRPGSSDNVIQVSTILNRMRRRYPELSHAELLDRVWDLEHLPQQEAEATGLLRIWASEIELSNERDMIGIWQVIQNVRARHCDNSRFGQRVARRIIQCRTSTGELVEPGEQEVIENAEETYLSAMRRLSSRSLGGVPARTARGRWIREITLSCEEPESWNRERPWAAVMGPRCREYAPLARALVSGRRDRRISPAVLIAWGGRCERHCDNPSDPSTCRQTGACDDGIACRRGLARIPDTTTSNAFWCRPGTRGCPSTIDPLCRQFGLPIESIDDPPRRESSSQTDLTNKVTSS